MTTARSPGSTHEGGGFSFSFDLRLGEYVRLNRTLLKYRRRSPLERTVDWLLRIVVIVGPLAAVALALAGDSDALVIIPAFLILLGAAWALLYGAFPLLAAGARLGKPRGSDAIHISAEGIRCENELRSDHYSWDFVERVTEAGGFLLFHHGGNRALHLPMRVVPDEARGPLRAFIAGRTEPSGT